MSNKHYIDLSDIKDDELDKTASFTDLMSRSEKKERERQKEEEKTRELKEILMNDEDKKELKKKEKKEKKRKEKNIIEVKDKQTKEVNQINTDNLSKTQKFVDFTKEIQTSMLNNVDTNLDVNSSTKKKKGILNIFVADILIIISLSFYIYSIIFTSIQTNQLYLLIGGCFILGMITLFCLSIISNRILYKIFSILNYLVFIAYVLFNLTLVTGIINI